MILVGMGSFMYCVQIFSLLTVDYNSDCDWTLYVCMQRACLFYHTYMTCM